jgi:hypothetical protein
MKNKILLLLIAFSLLAGTSNLQAQKKDPRALSGKNLHNTLSDMMRNAKDATSHQSPCDPNKVFKTIPKKKLLPTKEELTKQIGRIIDTLDPKKITTSIDKPIMLDYFMTINEMTKFVAKFKGKDYALVKPKERDEIKEYYYKIRRNLKSGFNIFNSKFKHGECTVTVNIILKPLKWKKKENATYVTLVDWQITSEISINCPCTAKNKHRVKSAFYNYTAKTTGPMMFDRSVWDVQRHDFVSRVYYGLRFGKIEKPELRLVRLICCKENESKTEDGSFTSPEKDINNDSTLLDTGIGIGFGEESDTEAVFAGGVLFNVVEVGGNPLFVGPKATVNTTSIGGDDTKETRVLIGPTAEYQIPVGAGKTKILAGINSGYLFGNLDAFGVKRDLSGFAANAYAGAQIKVGNNIALSVMLNFLEYSSITFKADNEEFENTVSNTTFLTDRGAISVGVRIGLDKN